MDLTLPLWLVVTVPMTLLVLGAFAACGAARLERRRLLGIIGRVMLKETFESFWADRMRYLLRDLSGADDWAYRRCSIISFRGQGSAKSLPDEEAGGPTTRSER